MQTNLEKQILLEAKGLPGNALGEVLHFIQFLKLKWLQNKTTGFSEDLTFELNKLGDKEWDHLENEIKDYKNIFPHAK